MKDKIKVTINLLNRNNDELIQSNINLDELIEKYENQKSDFHKNYSVNIEILFDGYGYTIEDYYNEFLNEPLNKIDNICTYGNKVEDIEGMYHFCDRQDKIDELYSVQYNEYENILQWFDSEEEARAEMQNSEYNKYDEYCYYEYSTGLISFDEIPFNEYSEEIFNLWLKEIIYL